jgi:hypothetical protein
MSGMSEANGSKAIHPTGEQRREPLDVVELRTAAGIAS